MMDDVASTIESSVVGMYSAHPSPSSREKLAFAARRMGLRLYCCGIVEDDYRGKAVLDAGCGTGEYACWLASRGGHVTGIDLSDGSLQEARGYAEAACMVALPCVAVVALGVMRWADVLSAVQYLRETQLYRMTPHLGVMAERPGKRLVLSTGAVAWLARPPGDGPFPGALLFHGAHSDGSQQSAALILRRALLHAGFIVLAVDHPGYGESPAPRIDGAIEQWDPLPGNLAALQALRSVPAVDGIFAVGHSMGTVDVFRLCRAGADLRAAMVFGASLEPPNELNDYWYRRFHTDRRLRDRLPPDTVLEIRRRFYDREAVRTMPSNHPPILFVRFEIEHADIVETRDALYAMIPGRKAAWDFVNSNHYFTSKKAAGIVVGDTRVLRPLASKLRRFRDELSDAVNTV